MDIFAHLEKQNIILTAEQRRAVTADAPAILLLAVPGAGKTTTLAARAAWLMATGRCAPREMLNLTFNREAAADMGRRFHRLFGTLWTPEQQPTFSTIHSFCYRLLGDYAASRGTQMPKLLAEGEQRRLVAQLYRSQSNEYLTEEAMDRLINAIGLCTNMMYTPEECRRLEREHRGLEQVRTIYKEHKLEHHLMDFDDLLAYALQVLRRQPARAAALREQYRFLHLDEAQDTSLLQHAILEELSPQHLFFVGDEDQSIYGFRGAFPEALLEFATRHPGGQVLKLEENFRSVQPIVRAADSFIAANQHRYAKAMQARRDGEGGVRRLEVPSAHLQYQYVANELKNILPGETAAVLYRGGLSAAAMGDLLLRENIPFALRAKRYPLLQDSVARDILSMVRLALDPGDGPAFLQVYYKLGCYITRQIAQRAVESGASDLLYYLAEEEDFPGKSTARLAFLRAFFRRMKGWKPERAIDRIIYELDYIDGIQKRGESGYTDEAAAHKLAALRSIAGGCEDLAAFADRLAGLDERIDQTADPNANLTLSTIHSSKGREFDRVWLVDLFEGVFPGSQAVEENLSGSEQALEEEARMFYVAATRAKNQLTLCTAHTFCGYDLLVSRFVPRLLGQEEGASTEAAPGVRRGVRLSHKTFGFGTVEEVSAARGTFTVRFAKLGVKTFAASSLDGDIFRIL